MSYLINIEPYKAFVLDLDDVLYPEKDYLLQVYYLFAQFIEYTEQIEAAKVLEPIQRLYQESGRPVTFDQVAEIISLPEKYRHNFDLLHKTARLPLKLLFFQTMLEFLQQSATAQKKILLLADGDPETQLNKIRQMEWNGLEQHVQVFFTEELGETRDLAIKNLLMQASLLPEDVLVIDEKF